MLDGGCRGGSCTGKLGDYLRGRQWDSFGTVYSISGNPADVTVVQPSGSQFGQTNDGTPSVTFDIMVSSNAVPGPRNIMVANPTTGELSAFVGGILITPSGQ